jgi:hypothetical protein
VEKRRCEEKEVVEKRRGGERREIADREKRGGPTFLVSPEPTNR